MDHYPVNTETDNQEGELLVKMFGEELINAFKEFKSVWDPDWKMNPGKIVSPYRLRREFKVGEQLFP